MQFTNQLFLFIFLPLVCILYFALGRKFKKVYLTAISLLFLASFSYKNAITLLNFTILNYYIATKIKKSRKLALVLGIITNVLFLVFYKYLGFITTNINFVFKTNIQLLDLLIPVGLSFIIFQNISFLVDVYKGEKQSSLVDYVLYTFYFPRLINGPIMKYGNFVKEINTKKKVETNDVFNGIKRICYGLGKVSILSFVLGNIWSTIYSSVGFASNVLIYWIGIVAYSLHLYLNFSGFIDISIGISNIFGIKIPENFDYPYLSKSISEFWRRWHISLFNWLKEYVYIPLGGSRKGNIYVNIMIVFLISGIWHGASWNFIVWGIYLGIINIIDRKFVRTKLYKKIPNIGKVLYTFIFIMFGWVFFASNGISAAINYFKSMFGLKTIQFVQYDLSYFINSYNITFIVLSLLVSFGVFKLIKNNINKKYVDIFEGVLAIIILLISIMFIINNSYTPSLYANF